MTSDARHSLQFAVNIWPRFQMPTHGRKGPQQILPDLQAKIPSGGRLSNPVPSRTGQATVPPPSPLAW
jgi:hypothetical protein